MKRYTAVIMVVVWVLVVLGILMAYSVSHDNDTACRRLCYEKNETYLGTKDGKCVCSPNLLVRNYYES